MTANLLLVMATFAATASEAPVPKPAADQGVRPAEWSELRSGEVVTRIDGTKEGIGSAAVGYVVVRATWTRAFEIVADRERMTEYSTCLKSLVVLSREQAGGVERTKARETHQTMRIRRRYTVDYEDDIEKREIRWSLDRSAQNDVAELSARWHFVALDPSTTLIHVRMTGNAGGGMPKFFQEHITKIGLGKSLAQTRDRIQSLVN